MTTKTSREPRLRHDPPEVPGYILQTREAIPINRLGIWAILSGIPWAALFAIIGLYMPGAEGFTAGLTLWSLLRLAAILLILVPLLHEAVHGLMALMVGARPFFGIGEGYAYTSFHEAISPRQYMLITAAPLLVLSLLSIATFVLAPHWYLYIVVFAAGNAAGATGDLWVLNRVRHLPPDAIIYDLADGYAAFTPSTGTEG